MGSVCQLASAPRHITPRARVEWPAVLPKCRMPKACFVHRPDPDTGRDAPEEEDVEWLPRDREEDERRCGGPC